MYQLTPLPNKGRNNFYSLPPLASPSLPKPPLISIPLLPPVAIVTSSSSTPSTYRPRGAADSRRRQAAGAAPRYRLQARPSSSPLEAPRTKPAALTAPARVPTACTNIYRESDQDCTEQGQDLPTDWTLVPSGRPPVPSGPSPN